MNAIKIDKNYVGNNTRDNRNKVTRADKIYSVLIVLAFTVFFIGFAINDLMG